ncbi:MAG: branched-chain amino acid aminotransferase [Jatrophihabitantaceae bacterium]
MSPEFVIEPSATPLAADQRAAILTEPGFGKYFTDHMSVVNWTATDGWTGHRVVPLAPFELHPSAAVLHYGQEIFEGMKAYRHADGSIWLFRPEANARRFARSAQRLALPELDEQSFLTSLVELIKLDHAWVPDYVEGAERSLYLRPFMFASEAFLGVRPAAEVTYAVIAGPAASYFASGITGVTLWVSGTYTRAAPGGTGAAKCGGNYASGLAGQLEAHQHGCDQALYLDVEHKFVEESGTMNLCLVTSDGELLTPGLGTILEGVTRNSVLALAAEHGLTPVERRISIDELRSRGQDGSITEMFAAGTAAVITPVVGFRGDGYEVTLGNGEPGKQTIAIREHLLDIQYGRVADTHSWLYPVR